MLCGQHSISIATRGGVSSWCDSTDHDVGLELRRCAVLSSGNRARAREGWSAFGELVGWEVTTRGQDGGCRDVEL